MWIAVVKPNQTRGFVGLRERFSVRAASALHSAMPGGLYPAYKIKVSRVPTGTLIAGDQLMARARRCH